MNNIKKILGSVFILTLLALSVAQVNAFIDRTGLDRTPQRESGEIVKTKNEQIKKDFLYDVFNFGNTVNEKPVIVPTESIPTTAPEFPDVPGVTNYPPPNANGLINPNSSYSLDLTAKVQACMNNKSIYQQVERATGVHWAVIAGIHLREGGCNLNQSLVSGRAIGNFEPDVGRDCSSQRTGIGIPEPVPGGCGFSNFLDSAIYGANKLIGKISVLPQNEEQLAKALSRYNGGGNSNCGKVSEYKYCPRLYEGHDVMSAIGMFTIDIGIIISFIETGTIFIF
jgi:hypothetical protein